MTSEEAREDFYSALLDDDPEQLYERAPCGYLSTTPDGTIVKVNQTFLTLTGYERQQLLGRRTFAELLTAGGRIYHETHYAPMLRMQGAAREIALDIVKADGSRLPVLVNAVVEQDANGNPLVTRTAVFDATDRRGYELELLRAKQRAEESEQRAVLLAQTLQATLIPPAPPEIPGLVVSAAYRPAGDGHEVGGDFYDVFQLRDGVWFVVVGDVRGKGVDAAVLTALVRYTVRAAAVQHGKPAEVLRAVNEVLLRDPTDRFCTVVVARLDRADDGWRGGIACGGHPLPVMQRAGAPAELVGTSGMLLGLFETVEVDEASIVLASGDALVLYTDGVTEARREDEFLEEEGLLAVVDRHRGAGDLASAIVAEVLSFQDGNPRDDVALVAVRVP